MLFVNTETAFSTVNTIIGTVLGFLCGIYVPMSALPNYVQSIIHFFPVSHITVLLRNTFMTDSFDKVFGGNVVDSDSTIKVNDVAKLYQFIKGKINNL